MSRKRVAERATEGELPEPEGRYCYEGLDRVLHEKARLGILASLAAHANGLLFNDLKQLCTLTDGNLSAHSRTLEEAGYISVEKTFKGRRPHTAMRLTSKGRKAFERYVGTLQQIIDQGQGTKKDGT